jgi:hypothetical protein
MSHRLALVIGMRDYDSPMFPPLPVAENDASEMQACLAESGYQVTPYGLEVRERAGSTIFQKLQGFCRTAPEASTLLIYFSGHGLHYRGKDYFVPGDFESRNAADIERLLVPIDISAAVEESRAHTVVLFVDACRIGVDLDNLGAKASVLVGWGKDQRQRARNRSTNTILGCSSGQVCQYVDEGQPFSLFTRALVTALRASHPAKTLTEIITAAQIELDRLVNQYGKRPQTICISSERQLSEPASDPVICDGPTSSASSDQAGDPWTRSVRNSLLWTGMRGGLADRLKGRIESVIAECRREFESALVAFPEDTWVDEYFPSRVLDRLAFLIEHSDPVIELSDAERALLIIAPFFREGVLRHGVRLAAQAGPFDFDPASSKASYRNRLEQAHQSYPQLVRKAKRLAELDRPEERNAVAAWIVHRALLRDPEIWSPTSGDLFAPALWQCLREGTSPEDATGPEDLALAQSLDPHRVIELAKCVCCDPERLRREDGSQLLPLVCHVGAATPAEQGIRFRVLGHLLSLAGWLAIDVRMLSDVVVDHIGLANPLTPSAVLRHIRLAGWHPVGRARSLHVTCEHPAADLAFRDYASCAGTVLASCHRAATELGGTLTVLSGLPSRLTDDGVVPAQVAGTPAYTLPHVRFELAHDEIRELLMGERLYGSPVFAIRELYQNALDAIRYRQARLAYLRRTQRLGPKADRWKPRIIFRQGVTQDGRPYLECDDNGIGMGSRELSECFARAGKRFTALPEFIEERAEWMRCDPPIHLYPNSQFGVGVFSYFMLADELLIETCRLGRDGKPSSNLEVHVSSSGSLFRVRVLGEGEEPGTRIRLFLNRTTYQSRSYVSDVQRPILCSHTLAELLGVAEFPVTIEENGKRFQLLPGQLNLGACGRYTLQEAFPSGDPDVWWCNGEGLALADGIAVRDLEGLFSFHRPRWALPLVVNFHGPHYPNLTVNRTQLVEYDRAWLDSILEAHWKSACDAPFLSLEWLLKFHEVKPLICRRIVESLWGANAEVPLGSRHQSKMIVGPIQRLGWWPGDLALLELVGKRLDDDDLGRLTSLKPAWWVPHRLRYLEELGLAVGDEVWEHLPRPRTIKGPIPAPGDEVILHADLFDDDVDCFSSEVPVDIFQLACRVASRHVSIPEALARLERYSGCGIILPSAETRSAVSSITLSREDLVVLSYRLDGKPPYLPHVPGERLLRASAALMEPVGQLHSGLRRLGPLGVEVGNLDVDAFGGIVISQIDARTIALISESGRPGNIVSAAVLTGQSLIEAFRRYNRFVPLVPELPNWDPDVLEGITPEANDLVLLSVSLQGGSPWVTEVSPEHITEAANALGVPKAAVVRALKKYEPLGITLPPDSGSKRKKRR